MKSPSDFRSLFFLLLIFIFQVGVIGVSCFTSISLSILAFLFVVNICLVFQASAINHNHRHCPVFLSELLNKILNGLLSLTMLAPSSRLHAVHVFNHHAHYQTDGDWSSSKFGANARPGILRTLSYLWQAGAMIFKNRPRLRISLQLKKQIKQERAGVILYFVILCLWSPWVALLWLLPSCTLGLALLLLVNMVNHDQCSLQSEWNHSRNFHAKIENWLLCNNGFHTIHHLLPGTHWSEYPALHQKLAVGRIDASLEKGSLFFYVLKNYLIKI